MTEWFYSEFGQTKGPVSEAKLIDMLLKQELEPDSYITDGINKPWKKVKDFPELLEKVHKPENLHHKVTFGGDFFEDGKDVRVGNLYFYIPISRFLIMTLLSCGLYQWYWFYKQWFYWAHSRKLIRRSISREPSWWFFPFTIFGKIETDKELNAVIRADFNGTLLFWMWIGFGAFLGILQATTSSMSIMYHILLGLGLIANVVFLIPIQNYINRVNAKLGNNYDKPGFGHYLCLIAGIAVLLYIINMRQLLLLFQV